MPFEQDYRATFDARHQQTYGYANPRRGAEVVNLRVKAIGVTDKPALPRETAAMPSRHSATPEPSSRRTARFGGKATSMAVYRRDDLHAGMEADGPALIAGPEATTVITPAFRFRVDEAGNIIATRRAPRNRTCAGERTCYRVAPRKCRPLSLDRERGRERLEC